jgi:hypothetical protein
MEKKRELLSHTPHPQVDCLPQGFVCTISAGISTFETNIHVLLQALHVRDGSASLGVSADRAEMCGSRLTRFNCTSSAPYTVRD